MKTICRFVAVGAIACVVITVCGRILFDFEEPPEADPYDCVRGLAVFVAAASIAAIDLALRRYRRKKKLQ